LTEIYATLADLAPLAVWNGVRARAVRGAEMTLSTVELDPGAIVSEHAHPNEQIGLVLQGSLTFTIGGERRELRAGESYVIGANVPHDAVAGADGCTVVDVFSPPRDDWERLERLDAARPAWP
jgi:quercetin dioxygenase-like cupin family protein